MEGDCSCELKGLGVAGGVAAANYLTSIRMRIDRIHVQPLWKGTKENHRGKSSLDPAKRCVEPGAGKMSWPFPQLKAFFSNQIQDAIRVFPTSSAK